MELYELTRNREYLAIEITNGMNALDLHLELRKEYPFMANTAVIITDNILYYLLNMEYGNGTGFSLKELRQRINPIGICYTISTDK